MADSDGASTSPASVISVTTSEENVSAVVAAKSGGSAKSPVRFRTSNAVVAANGSSGLTKVSNEKVPMLSAIGSALTREDVTPIETMTAAAMRASLLLMHQPFEGVVMITDRIAARSIFH